MTERQSLPRRIGVGGALMLAFNGAIGASIFALPATLAADFGTSAPWLFPLVGLASLLIAIPFSRSVAAFPESGGPATYGRVFGSFAGFELGWIYYVARATAFAANLNVLISYLARWWTGAEGGALRIALMLVAVAVFALINIRGVGPAMRVLGGFTILKTVPLVLAAIAALVMAGVPPPGPLPPLNDVEAGILIVFYAFVGFENAVIPAGETKNPSNVLPRAILVTIAVTTLLYFVVQLAFVSALPGGAADEKAPLIDLGWWLAGSVGAATLTLAAVASLAGSLHGIMTSTPRVTYALGLRGDIPAWFARVQPKFETPANSIVFFAFFSGALAVSGSFVWLAVVSTLARMFVYAVTIAALRRAPGRRDLGPIHYVVGALGILVCVWAAAQADAKAWITLVALAAAGLLLYAIASFGRRMVAR